MEQSEIIQYLRRLDRRHLWDGDGGYWLVDEIRKHTRDLCPESQQEVWEALLELIGQQDSMWGIALEVLTQEQPDGIARRLTDFVTSTPGSDEWKNNIVLALLRVQYAPAAPVCVSHIRGALSHGERGVTLASLAALCGVDPENCLAMSSGYFAHAFKSDQLAEERRGIIQTFVAHFMRINGQLLPALVERTMASDSGSAKRLAKLVDEELTRPWNVRRYGEARLNAIRREIRRLAS